MWRTPGAGEFIPSLLLGVYHHPPPPDVAALGITGTEIAPTNTHELEAFISAYVAKALVFLRRLPPV